VVATHDYKPPARACWTPPVAALLTQCAAADNASALARLAQRCRTGMDSTAKRDMSIRVAAVIVLSGRVEGVGVDVDDF